MPPYNIDEAIVVPQFIRSSRANTLLIHYLSLSSRSSPQDVSFSISNLYRMCGAHARVELEFLKIDFCVLEKKTINFCGV